jgi:Cu+-exporting ATPase
VSVVTSSLFLKLWKRPAWMDAVEEEEKGGVVRRGAGWGLLGGFREVVGGLFGERRKKGEGYVPLDTLDREHVV